MATYTPLRMTGMCRNGAERDGGRIFHAVPGIVQPGGSWQKALCGAQPGIRGNGWNQQPGQMVTCPRCLKKLAKNHPALQENRS